MFKILFNKTQFVVLSNTANTHGFFDECLSCEVTKQILLRLNLVLQWFMTPWGNISLVCLVFVEIRSLRSSRLKIIWYYHFEWTSRRHNNESHYCVFENNHFVFFLLGRGGIGVGRGSDIHVYWQSRLRCLTRLLVWMSSLLPLRVKYKSPIIL